jgi:hypothetical protein
MEALKMHRPYISTAEDGSGWVSVNSTTEQGGYAFRFSFYLNFTVHTMGLTYVLFFPSL